MARCTSGSTGRPTPRSSPRSRCRRSRPTRRSWRASARGTPRPGSSPRRSPARALLPTDRYVYPLLGAPVATLQTSRGCPYPCGYYCPYPLVEGKAWRAQSPERVLAEIRDVVERHGIRKIYFRDATFTLDQKRAARLCELIREAGWRLEWMCETRVDCRGDALPEQKAAA